MMPSLEEEIEKSIKWEDPNVQGGKNTLPIGPIRWEKGNNGSMKAVAVGSEGGRPRRKVVFTVPNPVKNESAKGSKAVINTPIDEGELRLTTVGTATQPEVETPTDDKPPADSPSPSSTPQQAATETTLPIRQGTSESRFEQQQETHASGQLERGTPHTALNDHGSGDKTVTMEPSTVGQAPKDVSIPSEQPPAQGYLAQAKGLAASATSAVTSTVGSAAGAVANMAGGNGTKVEKTVEQKSPEKTAEQKEIEKKIDGTEDPAIEGFLRAQTESHK